MERPDGRVVKHVKCVLTCPVMLAAAVQLRSYALHQLAGGLLGERDRGDGIGRDSRVNQLYEPVNQA